MKNDNSEEVKKDSGKKEDVKNDQAKKEVN
jgi:hypothetical protein